MTTRVPANMVAADVATQAELDAEAVSRGNADTALGLALTRMTTQASTSGVALDFTAIPAGAKRITINFSGVSTSGTSNPLVQLGDSGGIETTGYLGASGAVLTATAAAAAYTTGFGINVASAASVLHGTLTLVLLDAATNLWAASGVLARSDAAVTHSVAGSKALSAVLDRVRITTVGGADTFDAGLVSVSYD